MTCLDRIASTIHFLRNGQLLRKAFMALAVFALLAVLGDNRQIAAAPTKPTTATTLAVTSGTSSSPVSTVSLGSVVTLTATVTAGSTPLTVGQVSFCDASAKSCTDFHLLGLSQLTSPGTAVVKFRPGPGTHQYKAVFAGTTQYRGSASATTSLDVTGPIPTTTTLAETGNAGNYTLTATVYGYGASAPGGEVSFLNTSNGSAVLGKATLGSPTTGFNLVALPGTSALLPPAVMVDVIATGDFNGDGILDLAVGNEYDPAEPLTILLGAGDGTFNPVSTSYSSVISPGVMTIAVGDFNCDGKVDLAVSTGSGINILLGNGDGTFTVSPSIPPTGSEPNTIVVADFDGDGIPDLAVVAVSSGRLSILLGKGDGTFTAKYATPANSVITTADFNGDGIPDLAVGITSATTMQTTVALYLGKGDGTFTLDPYGPIPADEFAVADFNGDGIPDLAAETSSSLTTLTISILTGNGDGTFTLAGQPSLGINSGAFPASLVAADFNGDGIADLALQTVGAPGQSAVTVLRGDGAGGFAATSPASTPTPASNGMAVGDWNGDGSPDLAVVAQANGGSNMTVTVLQSVNQTVTAAINGITLAPDSGSFEVVASYPGDSDNQASLSAPLTLSAPLAAPSISISLSSSSISSTQALSVGITVSGPAGIPTPQGTVVLSGSGYTSPVTTLSSAGTATISVPAGYLALGSDTLTVTFTPSSASANSYTSATQTATVTVIKIGAAAVTVTVSPAAADITDNQNLNVSVTIGGGQSMATPTGSVQLASGAYSAQMALSSGAASFSIPAGNLSSGKDTLTATYSGDATYAGASGTGTVTVVPVSMGATAPSPVAPGASATVTLTLTAGSSYSGTVNLTCALTKSPANAQSQPTCALSSATDTVAAGGTATATMTVKTTAATSAMLTPSKDRLWRPGAEAVTFAALFLIGIGARRRRWQSVLALLVIVLCAISGGCGGGGSRSTPTAPATSAGSYVFTVNAADSKNAAITTSADVSVTVQ